MAVITESITTSPTARRVSWGAILAGVVVGLTVHVVMAVMGIAIGASVINPMTEQNPASGIAIGSGIYFVLSWVVAMVAGGYVAGALAALQTRHDRSLHGLATWAVVTLLSVLLLATGLGRLIGGTMNILGEGLSQVGRAASAVAQPIAGEVREELRNTDVDLDALRREATELLRDTGARELQPSAVGADAERAAAQAGRAVERAARDPQAADEELQRVFDRIQRSASETIGAADRDALVNVLVERTDMSPEQARQTVANWERGYAQAYQQAQSTWQQTKAQASQTAREWGQASADAIATAAWWTLFVLVLGAVAAVVGANIGSSRMLVATRTDVRR